MTAVDKYARNSLLRECRRVSARPSATLITCMRNEGPFLIEWLAYHRAIGFDRFIIGANDCTDGSHEMLLRLAELGEVIYLPFSGEPEGLGPQYQFADLLHAARHIVDGDWIAWLDLDEFLVVHRGDCTIQTLLRDLGKADGMRVNWRFFGVPPSVPWPGRQIHKDLCHCAPVQFTLERRDDHHSIKSIYRFATGMRIDIRGPILSEANLVKTPDWRGGNGKALRRRAWPRKRIRLRVDESPFNNPGPVSYVWAQINHYATRHPTFAKIRRSRGRGSFRLPENIDSPAFQDFANRHSDAYFATYNQYSDHDPSILRHIQSVDEQSARLLVDDTLRHWHQHALTHLPDIN